jgi:sugar lactone lactonase YvrE
MKPAFAALILAAAALSLPASAQPEPERTITAPFTATLSNPNGLAFDLDDHLWVANSGANQVLELNPANGKVLNIITTQVSQPTRLCFDILGNLWVTNLGTNTVTEYDDLTVRGGHLIQTVSNAAIQRPLGLAVDVYGDMYVANNSADNVTAFHMDDTWSETLSIDKTGFPFGAPGCLAMWGQSIYACFGPGRGENAVIGYNVGEFLTGDPKELIVYNDDKNTGPTGVAFDQQGNAYISEYYSGTWVKYSPRAPSHPTVVMSEHVDGPEGIALDLKGHVFVSNSRSNDIAVFKSSGAYIRTIF